MSKNKTISLGNVFLDTVLLELLISTQAEVNHREQNNHSVLCDLGL